MVQLTTEQRAYLIKTFYETRSLQIICESFRERFPERQAPTLKQFGQMCGNLKHMARV